MIGEIVKSYLVSLGFSVDQKSFEVADKAIDALETGVKRFAGTAMRQFALAGTSIVGALATANIGIATFLGSLAKADLEVEKFATRMWISKDAAAEINNTLKAMNATFEDLYLSPELLRNFQQLRATINEMKPPPEFQSQMKFIRSIQFEFQRMRLEGMYALQWIGFYLFKYLEGPIREIKNSLSDFNDAVTKSMPSWTRVIAQVLSWFVRLGAAAIQAGKDVLQMFASLSERIPASAKIIGAALLGLAIAIHSPFLGFSLIIGGILLLLDDFYTYLRGGESALEPLWKMLQNFFQTLKDTGAIDQLGKAFDRTFQSIDSAIRAVFDWLVRLSEKTKELGFLDALERSWSSTFGLLYQIVSGLWRWISSFFADLNREGILSGLIDAIINLGKEIFDTIGWVADLVSKFLEMEEVQTVLEGIGNFISGTFKFAIETVARIIDRIANSIKIIRSWLSGDDAALAQAEKEQEEIRQKEQAYSDFYGGKIKDFLKFMFVDANAPNPFLSDMATAESKEAEKINASINNLPKGLEPAFKKALNESEIMKGFRIYSQDLKTGFSLLASAINPQVFERYQSLATGTYLSSYMYATNSNQTIIRNENKPVFHIKSTDPKAAAQEVNQTWSSWSAMNIRNLRPVNG